MDYDALAQQFGGSGDGAADNLDQLAADFGGAAEELAPPAAPKAPRAMPADPTGLPQTWDVDLGGKKWRSKLTQLPDGRTVYTLPLQDGRTGIVQRRRDNGSLMLSPIEPSAAYKRGQQLPSGAQGGFAAVQGPALGFADELYGAREALRGIGRGDLDIQENYEGGRDLVRGAVAQAQADRPGFTMATQFAASAPMILAGGGAPAAGVAPVSMGRGALMAAKSGAIYGGINAAGNSEADSLAGLAGDTVKGAATSSVLGAASVPIARGMGAAGSAVMTRMSEAARRSHAKEKTVEALIRDTPEPAQAIERTRARLAKLGDDARLVDAADKNTRSLLDIVATTPGRTGPAVERAIRARKATRGDRLADAAESALGTTGDDFVGRLQSLDAQRQAAARPFYEQLDGLVLQADDDLAALVGRARPFFGDAQRRAQITGVPTADLGDLAPGGQVSLKAMETLKNTLFDSAAELRRAGKDGMARDVDALRRSLIDKLDDLSPKSQDGQPIYRLARDAWSGPSASMNAAELGRGILREDALTIPELTRGMGAAEREAFKVGVAQAVRDKSGTEAGQNQLLKMWANPSTRDKLKAVFGNDFRQFRAAVLAEEKKKAIESVGRGSQTAGRQLAGDDLDLSAAADGAQALAGAAKGNFGALYDIARRNLARVQTPEPVRDDIGRMLLSSGPEARALLDDLAQYTESVNRARARRAATAGTFFGVSPVPGLLVSP